VARGDIEHTRDWLRFARIAFTSRYAPIMAGTAGLTVALVAADNETWKRSHEWYTGSHTVKWLSDQVEWVGDGRPQFGLAAAFAAYGFVRKRQPGSPDGEPDRRDDTCERDRGPGPQAHHGTRKPVVSSVPGGRWDLFPNQIEYAKHVPHYDAYPSGHVTTALATVTVVIENYRNGGGRVLSAMPP